MRDKSRKSIVFVLLCAAGMSCSAQNGIKVLNDDAHYPEGPVWYHGKLYYVEYDRNAVMTWDGKKNTVFRRGKRLRTVRCRADARRRVSHHLLRQRNDRTHVGGRQDHCPPIPTTRTATSSTARMISPPTTAAESTSPPRAHRPRRIDGKVFYIARGRNHQPEGRRPAQCQWPGRLEGRQDAVRGRDRREPAADKFKIGADASLSDRRIFVNLDDLTTTWCTSGRTGSRSTHAAKSISARARASTHVPLAGVIFVVDAEGKLLRQLTLPSLQVPNFAFSPDEKTLYVTAVDQIDKSPYHGKVYSIPNR